MNKRATFNDMMDRLYEVENELIDVTDEDLTQMLGDVRGKVDGLKDWLDKLDFEKDRISEQIRKLQNKKKSIQNAKERYREYIAMVMIKNETPELFGESHRVTCKKQTGSVLRENVEITTMDYVNLKDMGVIERQYKVNARRAKEEFEKDPNTFGKFIEKVERNVIRFSFKKD